MSKKITKAELIAQVSQESHLSKANTITAMNALEVVVARLLQDGSTVTLHGVVKLTPKDRAARMVRNPATGETTMAAAKRVVNAKALATVTA